ncbi:Hemoglobin-like protein HbO [Rubellimicrobium mesophilum DSM 19309]|uniref:Hemoglobin-like protein HbO n=1 Tax=Rubellimicrobium mesophilum DSM 19309 TaxID=442562 RepID=A0A017HUQ5_9RHOB|nr:group II truncated hemoglobin [Rubellimicrobium mesophilum]EYD78101.1 Hemoglobin-like protein HbO [Rubellimicrobium mesophilum DSM 19309]
MAAVIEDIGGEPVVRALVERFYDLIETAPEGANILNLHFQGHGLAHVRLEQFDFLCGFFGGRRYYAERHGHMNLRELHAHVPIRMQDAEDWLSCMVRALDDTGVQGPARARIEARLRPSGTDAGEPACGLASSLSPGAVGSRPSPD